MDIFLEVFGYIGTALVLLSMTMTSIVPLRWLNLSGAVVSMLYAAARETWPVFVLNLCIILIHAVQLVKYYKMRRS